MSLADLTTEEVASYQLIEQGFTGVGCGVTLLRCKDTSTGEPCAVIAVFKPGIELGTTYVEPIARLLKDPNEVTEPVFEETPPEENTVERSTERLKAAEENRGHDDSSEQQEGSQ